MTSKKPPDLKRAQRIQILREQVLDLSSQDALAVKIGVSRGAVGNWELGQPIGVKYVKALAEMSGASIEWILSGTGPTPEKASNAMSAIDRPTTADALKIYAQLPEADKREFLQFVLGLVDDGQIGAPPTTAPASAAKARN